MQEGVPVIETILGTTATTQWTYRLAEVSVLVKSILGGEVILQVHAKLQVSLHQSLVALGPRSLALDAEDTVELLKSKSLFLLGVVSDGAVDQVCK
jgi:hypothetical protein